MTNSLRLVVGTILAFGILGSISTNAESMCTLCTRVVVMDSKKAACFNQQYEAAKEWFATQGEPAAAIRVKGCIPGLKMTFRGVQESFRVREAEEKDEDPDAKINVTEAGLDCLKNKLDLLEPEKLDPETLFDMKRVCS